MTSPLTPDQWKLLDPKLSGDAFQKEAARQQRRWLSYLYYSLRLALLPPEPSVTISLAQLFWEAVAAMGIGLLFIITLAYICFV